MYEVATKMGSGNSLSQAKELATALAHPFRSLRVGFCGLLNKLDPSSGTSECGTSYVNKIGDEPYNHNKAAIRASEGCIPVHSPMEAEENLCTSPPHPSAANSLLPDSPLHTFQSSDYPYATSADSYFLSYQDLNWTRVAAFADIAATPSVLAACKNGVYSPSPPSSCVTSPRKGFQHDQDDACSIGYPVCLSLCPNMHYKISGILSTC
jgi:hypothetical protein